MGMSTVHETGTKLPIDLSKTLSNLNFHGVFLSLLFSFNFILKQTLFLLFEIKSKTIIQFSQAYTHWYFYNTFQVYTI